MSAKFGVRVLFFILAGFLYAGAAWGQPCNAQNREFLPTCVNKEQTKTVTPKGGVVHWYSVTNNCGWDLEYGLITSDGQEIVVPLRDGQKDGASLPENIRVQQLYCCSQNLPCDGSGDAPR